MEFQWLSQAGRLVLVKSVLEVILVYWMSLSWIPIGILEKIRRICFKFLWVRTKDSFVLPWVSWEKLAVPKSLGGWGLKNIFLLFKSLGCKAGWTLVKTESIWTSVIIHKYIFPNTVEEWIQNHVKWFLFCDMESGLKSFSCNR
jgi:hypothetical protein